MFVMSETAVGHVRDVAVASIPVRLHGGRVPCPVAAGLTLTLDTNKQCDVAAADNPSSAGPIVDPTVASATPASAAAEDIMIFSDFYKGSRSPLARLRNGTPQLPAKPPTASPDWVGDEYTDLLSKDKAKNKEAVRRYLADKVRYDWRRGSIRFDDGYQVDESDPDSDDESVYSVVSEDNIHWRPRAEWTSDIDDEGDGSSSFGDSQSSLQLVAMARQTRRRRAIREEASWNPGLACFEARRNVWTGAKTVRVRSKPTAVTPVQNISPRSPRRFFFRRSMSSSPPSATAVLAATNAASADLSGTASDSSSTPHDELRKVDSRADSSTANTPATSTEETRTYPVQTLLPLAQPILPPSNPLRASITPNVYLGLYDKVILHNLQPSCPINLSDMLRSCVTGWKRDGEWPPRSTPYNPPEARKKSSKSKKPAAATPAAQPTEAETKAGRRLSFNLLNRDNDESRAGKGFRKSLQRAFGMAPPPGLGETA
ncbi:hypothetical protein LMH87_011999 [Akanthomyces muscarius]|uniref:Gag1-like clamp domain-containing protein n=1 Tax=Akanthomyces muscarius TaxID=2231603 RepID=A0A9W8QA86_AKAMU|nr:hypothetical protein LMH87_011999 [Akanthomyces muscarius]KAJ4151289.1 hypothetical protein LMH87_011999 [Akanthomyces muscarius]